jgi:hypothetical protein
MSKDDLPESNYLLDYDDSEKRRLQEQHELIKSYMGQLILAPVDLTQPGLKVLDSGTFDGMISRYIVFFTRLLNHVQDSGFPKFQRT